MSIIGSKDNLKALEPGRRESAKKIAESMAETNRMLREMFPEWDESDKYHELRTELIECLIGYQYRIDNPMPAPGENKETYIQAYRSNRLFHDKVDNLASGIMQVVAKYL